MTVSPQITFPGEADVTDLTPELVGLRGRRQTGRAHKGRPLSSATGLERGWRGVEGRHRLDAAGAGREVEGFKGREGRGPCLRHAGRGAAGHVMLMLCADELV